MAWAQYNIEGVPLWENSETGEQWLPWQGPKPASLVAQEEASKGTEMQWFGQGGAGTGVGIQGRPGDFTSFNAGDQFNTATGQGGETFYSANKAPPGATFKSTIQEFLARSPMGLGIQQLDSSGYLKQFADYDPNVVGSITAAAQNALDRDVFGGRMNQDDWQLASIPLAALGAGLFGGAGAGETGAAGAGDAALAGGGEVGSGYAASAPGASAGSAGGGLTQLAEGGNTMTDVPLVGDGTPEFTGGLTSPVQGGSSPGLNANGFNANNLGAGGGEVTSGGLTSPVAANGSGSLSPGFFPGETMYPVVGGNAAAVGATGLGTASSGVTAATTAGAVGGGTALSRLLDGTASTADYLSLLGTGAATGLGIYGASQQAKSLEELANQYMAMRAPSRLRYETSFMPGFSMNMDPGYQDALDQTTKSFLHKASVGGNPVDSPNAWKQTLSDVNSTFAYPAMQQYRSMNANAGGLSRFADAAPGAATGAINAQSGVYNALGYGAGNIFNPPSSLEQLLKQMKS